MNTIKSNPELNLLEATKLAEQKLIGFIENLSKEEINYLKINLEDV